MVIKGNARGGAGKLAAHLLRIDVNERMDVREISGVIGPDLTAALLEMETTASAARSRRPFYHASINTARDELMTDAQKARAIDRLEQELGLTGQPRIVVEHVKDGREHLHIAWSRIDGETLHAIPDSHNFRKHEIVARELEREFGHARVQGAHHEREGVERPDRRPSHAETMQAARSGITPEDAKTQLRELWQSADNGQSFAAALDNAGWTLAQGDRRGFVALDPAGETHAVNKAITGLSAAGVRERLADLDAALLPSVDQAREQVRARQRETEPAPAQTPEIDHQAAPEFEPVQDNHGHGLDNGGDPAHSRETDAEARARIDAAYEADLAHFEAMQRDRARAAAEAQAGIEAENTPQHRDARPVFDKPDFVSALDAARAREAQQRGDDSALNARNAMEDLARIDPLGTERNFGHHAGDRLKSPEEMRREWADLMRGGVSAERAAENATAWEKADSRNATPSPAKGRDSASQDPAPETSPQLDQADAQSRDPVADRAAWAERLRRFDRPDPTAERQTWAARLRGFAAQEAEPDRTRERTPEREPPSQAPENDHGGLFQRLRDKARQWFHQKVEAKPETRPHPDHDADRRHEPGGDERQEEHVHVPPPRKPVPEPEPARPRPAERMRRSIAEEWLAEARAQLAAERARETPAQRAERERRERDAEAEHSRGRGDGSRERTRYRHGLLWELLRPFQHGYNVRRRRREP